MKKQFQSKSVPRGTRTIWRYLGALFFLFTLGIGQMWAEDFTITSITNGSNLSPGNLVKVTYSGDLTTSSGLIKAAKTKSGAFTITTSAPNMYLKSATFHDDNISSNSKKATLTVASGGSLSGPSDGIYTFTASDNTTTATINAAAGSGGEMKLSALTVVVTNGSVNNMVTLATFSFSTPTISASSITCNGNAVTAPITLTSSTGWGASSNKISAPNSNSKYITVEAVEGKHLKYISFYDDANARLALTEKSPAVGTVVGASWTASDDETKSVTFYQAVGTSLTVAKVYVITEDDPAATTHKLEWNFNGGSCSATAGTDYTAGGQVAEGATITYPAASTMSKDGKDFAGWSSSATTMPTSDLTITALWEDHTTSNDATLSALSVAGCTFNETFDPATLAYTVDLPFYASMPAASAVTATKNDANASDPVVSISGNVISVEVTPESGAAGKKTYTITVNIADAPAASSSINIEQLILDNSTKYNIGAALDAAHISYANKDALDSLKSVSEKADRNKPYLGLKFKKNTSSVTIIVPDGQYLKVKFGYVDSNAGLKVSVNGATAVAPSLTDGIYTLPASAGIKQVVFTQPGTDKKTVVYKQIKINEEISDVILPWKVTYDAGEHGTCATTSQIWKGTALTLPAVTPASGWDFEGWYDGETKVTSPYNPGKDAALVAHYTAQAAGTDLETLTYQIGAGAATAVGYTAGYYTYNIELPYKPSYDAITVNVTPVTGASVKDDATKVLTVSSLPGAATFTVTDGVSEQLYTVNFTKKAKDGVLLIGTKVTGNTAHGTVYGYGAGTADVNVSSKSGDYTYKLNGGKYVGVTLADGLNFQAGDIVKIRVTDKQGATGFTLYTTKTADSVLIMDTRTNTAIENGIHELTLPAYAGSQSLYLLRQNNDYTTNMNPCVDSIAVYRPMNPVLTAITINGEACVKGEGNTFAVTLPEEGTNFASLAVEPTIIRNAAHATTPEAVISDEGAWKAGINTYRVMDKDGDYTDYTITITLQGQAPAPVIATQPAGVAYCAGSEPTLEVEATGNELHYAWFKEAGETDEAVGTDEASYTVEAAGTYYVIVTNHVDGKLDKSVTSENAIVTLNVAAAITTQPKNKMDIVSGSPVTLSVVATNATGYQWYICDDAEKHNASAISGAEAANYVFTCDANGFYYCVVGNACGEDLISDVVSVKLEPEGCNLVGTPSGNAYTKAGGWSIYPVNSSGQHDPEGSDFGTCKAFDEETDVNCVNTRRFAIKFEKDVESVTIYARGGTGRTFDKVSVADEMAKNAYTELTDITKQLVTIDGAGKEYIATAEGMIPGGKYAWFDFSGSFSGVFKICYTTALAMPKLPTLVNQELCAGAAYQEFDATITNEAACEGTVSYKWFSTADTENPVATTATFTPSTEGTYYVVVTHSAAGHITRTVQSDNLTVAHFDALTLVSNSGDVFQHMGTAATLSVVATGKNVAYVWYTCSNAAGDDAVAIDPAETEAELTIASILEGVHYYKVVISHDCDATTLSHVFKVEGWDQLEQVDVTATTTWDMTNVSADHIELTGSDKNARLLLANIDGVNNTTFNAQALKFEGQHIGRTEANIKHLAGRYVQFNVTVPGAVFVTFASNGNNARTIRINDKKCTRTTAGTAADKYITYALAVEPGSVEIMGMQGDEENQYVRISKIEFKAEASHTRPGLNPSYLGTLCWTNNAILGGGTLYKFAGKDEYNKLVFDEVPENRLEAGKPYIFMPENGNTEIKLYNTDDAEPLTTNQAHVNHMYGTIVATDLYPTTDVNMYYFSSNHIWAVKDFTVEKITVPAYYCYVDYPAVLAGEPAAAPAPGRRRVTMGVQGEQVVTGVENLNASEQPVKLLINGQIFILRGEKLFDATGRLVK